MKDAFDTQIREGDQVCYAVRRGSDMSLKLVNVTNVTDVAVHGYNPQDPMQRSVTLKQSKTMVVLPQPEGEVAGGEG